MPRKRPTSEPPIHTFRVRILGGFYAPPDAREIWREIEVAANQTLAHLGAVIPLAFEFYDPHLWSFFLSGKPWDQDTEYGFAPEPDLLGDEPAHAADEVRIRDVPYPGKTGKQEFLFLFDFGDEWHFGVKLLRTSDTVEPGADYPRVVATHGQAPPQYPDIDEDEEWDEDEDEDEGTTTDGPS